jgi:hypothetical protein
MRTVVITDAQYKHSLALARYIRRVYSAREIRLVGQISHDSIPMSLLRRNYTSVVRRPLSDMLGDPEIDFVIGVGVDSVKTLADSGYPKTIIPPTWAIDIARDKARTYALAKSHQIASPKTVLIEEWASAADSMKCFPCVVKERVEGFHKIVRYARSHEDLRGIVSEFEAVPREGMPKPIMQEFVEGKGVGFFALYLHGQLKRFYVHERIREFPVTGGASTCARTIVHERACEWGKTLLDALNWHGVAMVEFKWNPETDRLVLMEINPKFWGSTELGLAAGINFGALLIEGFFEGDIPTNINSDAYHKLTFSWPLDNDILSIVGSREWHALWSYGHATMQTNLKTNGLLLNVVKGMRTVASLITRRHLS